MSGQSIGIAVTFLAGRYHGREWPPSPGRLYQAMLAGVMTGGYREHLPKVELALRWLEKHLPPTISTAKRDKIAPYRIAVPNNDLDRAGLEWAAGREANPAQYRTMKTVEGLRIEGETSHVIYQWSVDPSEISIWNDGLRQAAHCLHTFG